MEARHRLTDVRNTAIVIFGLTALLSGAAIAVIAKQTRTNSMASV
jgi:hypothetical protein